MIVAEHGALLDEQTTTQQWTTTIMPTTQCSEWQQAALIAGCANTHSGHLISLSLFNLDRVDHSHSHTFPHSWQIQQNNTN